jgi:hypothetical protein
VRRRLSPASSEADLVVLRLASLDQEAALAEREAAQIAGDQSRLRENVKAVGDRREGRELVARWLSRADEQEARLEALHEAGQRSEAERRALRAEIDAVVHGLEGERRPAPAEAGRP